jgi:hypothetical protein
LSTDCQHPESAVVTVDDREFTVVHWCSACGAIRDNNGDHGAPAGEWRLPGSQSRPGRPWLDDTIDNRVPELHSGEWPYDIRVCIGTENVIEVDKLYGPLVAQPVRVSIEGESWVIEREVEAEDPEPGTSAWVVCAKFPLDGEIAGTVR